MLVAATTLTVAACSLIDPLATPSEPFSDFSEVRLLQGRIIDEPVVPCTSTAHYQLHVESEPTVSGPDCGFPQRQPEFGALTVLLETAFGL